jgi:hypothetical protein
MYTGTWRFILIYKDANKKEHRQTCDYEMGELAFPPPPFNVEISDEGDHYEVSWSGIGEPPLGPKDIGCQYRVRLFHKTQPLILGFIGDAEYDTEINKVTVVVPLTIEYEGDLIPIEGYPIRLENRFLSPGASGQRNQFEPLQFHKAVTYEILFPKSAY